MPKGLVQMDYKSAEAVAVAYLAQDERSKEAFAKGWDTHRMAYADIYNIKDWRTVTKEQRDKIGKPVRHMTNYDGGARALARKIKCPIREAEFYLTAFKGNNPHIPNFHQSVKNEIIETGKLRNPFGRVYPALDRKDHSFWRSMYAWLPASTVADMLNKALTNFYFTYGSQWNLYTQLHDAMYIQVEDIGDEKDIINLVNAINDVAIQPLIIHDDEMIIETEFSLGLNWGTMYEIKLKDGDVLMDRDGWKPYKEALNI